MRYSARTIQSNRGQASSVLILVLAMFVVGPLAIFSYELSRFYLAKQELKECVDLCALTGAATNASSNDVSPLGTQQTAIATALNMFQKNWILDQSLITVTDNTPLPLKPAANQTLVNFQFLDPVTRQPVSLGSSNGKIMQVTAAFGFVPTIGQTFGLTGIFPAQETSNAGLPQLDIILCFDTSASMDDFTCVSIVDRYNSPVSNSYQVISQGPLYSAFQCTSATGTAVNATSPQELDASSGSSGVYRFDPSLRGINSSAYATGSRSSTSFTDLVVNIDGSDTFSTGTSVTYNNQSYNFPANCVGCLVEAARGNLESIATANSAHVPYLTWGVTPQPGYYQAYQQAAFSLRHPIADAIAEATNFFNILNNDCDAHFGLVTFSSQSGTSATSTVPADFNSLGNVTDDPSRYLSNNFPADPYSPLPPNPTINLDPTAGTAYSNLTQVKASLAPLVAYGGTDIAGTLKNAITQMLPAAKGGKGLARPGASKAIVLFTDGLPTASSVGGNPTQDSRTEALAANAAGIPIYCIGLCLVPSLQSAQTAILTDGSSNPNSGGIAGISGNGAKFFQATKVTSLSSAFANVARALVQLVR